MENAITQNQEPTEKLRFDAIESHYETQKPNTILPLMITLIGIFCYLGVILPSVFEASSTVFNYSVFDLLLMTGGAALVGLGAYFWFTARPKVLPSENNNVELT